MDRVRTVSIEEERTWKRFGFTVSNGMTEIQGGINARDEQHAEEMISKEHPGFATLSCQQIGDKAYIWQDSSWAQHLFRRQAEELLLPAGSLRMYGNLSYFGEIDFTDFVLETPKEPVIGKVKFLLSDIGDALLSDAKKKMVPTYGRSSMHGEFYLMYHPTIVFSLGPGKIYKEDGTPKFVPTYRRSGQTKPEFALFIEPETGMEKT